MPREANPYQAGNFGAFMNARCGKLTGSRMSAAMAYLKQTAKEIADKKPKEDRKERGSLKIEILCERMTGNIVDKYINSAMQWGIEKEPEAKAAYEKKTGRLIKDVGFIDHPRIEFCGASPDGFVDDGLIEIKCPNTATHVGWILDGGIPEEHKAQMTLQAAVTGRSWVDFVSYDPRMPEPQQLLVRRFYPTAVEIAEIEAEAEKFLAEVDGLFETITRREMIDE
jgi:putative phage-type endonuclease